jgi:hypothetical protein
VHPSACPEWAAAISDRARSLDWPPSKWACHACALLRRPFVSTSLSLPSSGALLAARRGPGLLLPARLLPSRRPCPHYCLRPFYCPPSNLCPPSCAYPLSPLKMSQGRARSSPTRPSPRSLLAAAVLLPASRLSGCMHRMQQATRRPPPPIFRQAGPHHGACKPASVPPAGPNLLQGNAIPSWHDPAVSHRIRLHLYFMHTASLPCTSTWQRDASREL